MSHFKTLQILEERHQCLVTKGKLNGLLLQEIFYCTRRKDLNKVFQAVQG